jgi:hypothetical protein
MIWQVLTGTSFATLSIFQQDLTFGKLKIEFKVETKMDISNISEANFPTEPIMKTKSLNVIVIYIVIKLNTFQQINILV